MLPRAFVVMLGMVLAVPPLAAQCGLEWQPGAPAPGITGTVYGLTRLPNGDIVAGGTFFYADRAIARGLARWNGTEWQAFGSGTDGYVRCVVTLPNGDLVIGGEFTTIDGTAASNIARFDGQSWSAFGPGADGLVASFETLANGDLIVGGNFDHVGGVAADNIARWDGAAWTAIGTGLGPDGAVLDVVQLPNGDLVAGGSFASFGTNAIAALARWDGVAWTNLGVGQPAFIDALAVRPNGHVVIASSGGLFEWDGATFTGFAMTQHANALHIEPNGDLIAGGTVILVGNTSQNIARWDGSTWTSLGGGRSTAVRAILRLPNGDLVAGAGVGQSNTVGGYVGRWNGATWTELGQPRAPDVTAVVALPNGDVVAGGTFNSIGGVTASNVARWDGSAWNPLGLGVDGRVTAATAAPNGDLIIAGQFGAAGGAPATRVARWNGFAWSTLGLGLSQPAVALAATTAGDVYAVGGSGGAIPVRHWDGGAWTQDPAITGVVYAVTALPSGGVAIGGIVLINGALPVRVAVWNGTTWAPLPPIGAVVYALTTLPNGELVAAGFTTLNNNVVARYDGTTWVPIGPPLQQQVRSLAVLPNGDLVAGMQVASVGEIPTSLVVRWDGVAWQPFDGGVAPNPIDNAASLAASERGELFVAGAIQAAGDFVSVGIARATPTCPALVTTVGAGCVGSAGPVTLKATNQPWAGGTFTSEATGLPNGSIGLHAIGFVPTAAPLPLGAAGCSLSVTPALLDVVLPNAGVASTSLAIPHTASLAGQSLRTQVIVLELGAGLALLQTTSSNGLQLVIGAL